MGIKENYKDGKDNERWGAEIDSWIRSELIIKNNDCDGNTDETVIPCAPDYFGQDR